jgi:hypothetical protein
MTKDGVQVFQILMYNSWRMIAGALVTEIHLEELKGLETYQSQVWQTFH